MGVHISYMKTASYDHEPVHRTNIELAAEAMASPAPRWLTKVLSDFSFEVAAEYALDDNSPTRGEMYQSIVDAQQQAFGLIEFLSKTYGPAFVSAHSPELSEEFQRDLIKPLQKLAVGVNSIAKSML